MSQQAPPPRLSRPEFGDALLFLYIAVFARQCFWAVERDWTAWALTLAATGLVWGAHLRWKPAPEGRTPRVFWAVVALPLLLVFALRAAFPDLSFDVLNHRLIQGERALSGAQLAPGDFFPTIFPFNPAPDMLTGIVRHLLGYRLGTIINLLALVWAGTILEKILRPFVTRAGWRCAGVLLALCTEHVLFQVNNYMVDLLALPLVLEALRLALFYDETEHEGRDLLFAALLLGASMGLKLTNAAVALPVLAVFAVRVLSRRPRARTTGLVLLAGFLFLVPLLPHALYIYAETGSPVFPLYNNLIHSPLWPAITPYDGRWGPRDLTETLLWPVIGAWMPERLSELGVYSGRIALAVLGAALCLLLPRVEGRARLIALAVLLGSFLWTLTSGYVRYALFCEVLGGVLLVYLSRSLFERGAGWPRALKVTASALPLCLLCVQCALAARYVSQTEWSKRLTLFDDPDAYRKELRWAWRDRDLMKFQTAEARALFGRVEAWVVSDVKTNGVEVLLRPGVPMLAVNNLEYFDRRQSRARFAGTLERLRGRRVYSLSLTEDLDASLEFLKRRRLIIGEVTPVLVSFFSARTRLHMSLIEIGVPEQRETPRRTADAPDVTEAKGPLDDDAFDAQLSAADVPPKMRGGEKATIRVTVKNISRYVWPARGQKDGKYFINVADSWLDGGETLVDNMDGRGALPRDLWPGESVEVPLQINAPEGPGDYLLEIDLVQEGVTFFQTKGSQYPRYRVKVE
ncbi:MAG: hypothetical protein LC802_19590 [Acidobacteria bacterium]|nr:hypothetical protein [Acidobacteriota bacterium]